MRICKNIAGFPEYADGHCTLNCELFTKMAIEINAEFVKRVINQKNPNSQVCIELARKLETHSKGIVPEKLIFERRPSESDKVKDYRKTIYVPMTKNPIRKVFSSLSKIRRSQDWNTQYDAGRVPSFVAAEETLQDYCETGYPNFQSITNWAFSELLERSFFC